MNDRNCRPDTALGRRPYTLRLHPAHVFRGCAALALMSLLSSREIQELSLALYPSQCTRTKLTRYALPLPFEACILPDSDRAMVSEKNSSGYVAAVEAREVNGGMEKDPKHAFQDGKAFAPDVPCLDGQSRSQVYLDSSQNYRRYYHQIAWSNLVEPHALLRALSIVSEMPFKTLISGSFATNVTQSPSASTICSTNTVPWNQCANIHRFVDPTLLPHLVDPLTPYADLFGLLPSFQGTAQASTQTSRRSSLCVETHCTTVPTHCTAILSNISSSANSNDSIHPTLPYLPLFRYKREEPSGWMEVLGDLEVLQKHAELTNLEHKAMTGSQGEVITGETSMANWPIVNTVDVYTNVSRMLYALTCLGAVEQTLDTTMRPYTSLQTAYSSVVGSETFQKWTSWRYRLLQWLFRIAAYFNLESYITSHAIALFDFYLLWTQTLPSSTPSSLQILCFNCLLLTLRLHNAPANVIREILEITPSYTPVLHIQTQEKILNQCARAELFFRKSLSPHPFSKEILLPYHLFNGRCDTMPSTTALPSSAQIQEILTQRTKALVTPANSTTNAAALSGVDTDSSPLLTLLTSPPKDMGPSASNTTQPSITTPSGTAWSVYSPMDTLVLTSKAVFPVQQLALQVRSCGEESTSINNADVLLSEVPLPQTYHPLFSDNLHAMLSHTSVAGVVLLLQRLIPVHWTETHEFERLTTTLIKRMYLFSGQSKYYSNITQAVTVLLLVLATTNRWRTNLQPPVPLHPVGQRNSDLYAKKHPRKILPASVYAKYRDIWDTAYIQQLQQQVCESWLNLVTKYLHVDITTIFYCFLQFSLYLYQEHASTLKIESPAAFPTTSPSACQDPASSHSSSSGNANNPTPSPATAHQVRCPIHSPLLAHTLNKVRGGELPCTAAPAMPTAQACPARLNSNDTEATPCTADDSAAPSGAASTSAFCYCFIQVARSPGGIVDSLSNLARFLSHPCMAHDTASTPKYKTKHAKIVTADATMEITASLCPLAQSFSRALLSGHIDQADLQHPALYSLILSLYHSHEIAPQNRSSKFRSNCHTNSPSHPGCTVMGTIHSVQYSLALYSLTRNSDEHTQTLLGLVEKHPFGRTMVQLAGVDRIFVRSFTAPTAHGRKKMSGSESEYSIGQQASENYDLWAMEDEDADLVVSELDALERRRMVDDVEMDHMMDQAIELESIDGAEAIEAEDAPEGRIQPCPKSLQKVYQTMKDSATEALVTGILEHELRGKITRYKKLLEEQSNSALSGLSFAHLYLSSDVEAQTTQEMLKGADDMQENTQHMELNQYIVKNETSMEKEVSKSIDQQLVTLFSSLFHLHIVQPVADLTAPSIYPASGTNSEGRPIYHPPTWSYDYTEDLVPVEERKTTDQSLGGKNGREVGRMVLKTPSCQETCLAQCEQQYAELERRARNSFPRFTVSAPVPLASTLYSYLFRPLCCDIRAHDTNRVYFAHYYAYYNISNEKETHSMHNTNSNTRDLVKNTSGFSRTNLQGYPIHRASPNHLHPLGSSTPIFIPAQSMSSTPETQAHTPTFTPTHTHTPTYQSHLSPFASHTNAVAEGPLTRFPRAHSDGTNPTTHAAATPGTAPGSPTLQTPLPPNPYSPQLYHSHALAPTQAPTFSPILKRDWEAVMTTSPPRSPAALQTSTRSPGVLGVLGVLGAPASRTPLFLPRNRGAAGGGASGGAVLSRSLSHTPLPSTPGMQHERTAPGEASLMGFRTRSFFSSQSTSGTVHGSMQGSVQGSIQGSMQGAMVHAATTNTSPYAASSSYPSAVHNQLPPITTIAGASVTGTGHSAFMEHNAGGLLLYPAQVAPTSAMVPDATDTSAEFREFSASSETGILTPGATATTAMGNLTAGTAVSVGVIIEDESPLSAGAKRKKITHTNGLPTSPQKHGNFLGNFGTKLDTTPLSATISTSRHTHQRLNSPWSSSRTLPVHSTSIFHDMPSTFLETAPFRDQSISPALSARRSRTHRSPFHLSPLSIPRIQEIHSQASNLTLSPMDASPSPGLNSAVIKMNLTSPANKTHSHSTNLMRDYNL